MIGIIQPATTCLQVLTKDQIAEDAKACRELTHAAVTFQSTKKNRRFPGTPKWWVYHGKSDENGMLMLIHADTMAIYG